MILTHGRHRGLPGILGPLRAILLLAGSMSCTALAEDAGDEFARLEARLLNAERVTLRFDIRSTGAVVSSLAGSADLSPPDGAAILADGSFAGAAADIRLSSLQEILAGGNGDKTFQVALPQALGEGLLIGFTRMGLLHNLAMLSAGQPPDGTDGRVTDWVEVADLSLGETRALAGGSDRPSRVTVVVAGRPSGIAELWVDEETGLPVRRVQAVSFPEGEMRVLENYSEFRIAEDDRNRRVVNRRGTGR